MGLSEFGWSVQCSSENVQISNLTEMLIRKRKFAFLSVKAVKVAEIFFYIHDHDVWFQVTGVSEHRLPLCCQKSSLYHKEDATYKGVYFTANVAKNKGWTKKKPGGLKKNRTKRSVKRSFSLYMLFTPSLFAPTALRGHVIHLERSVNCRYLLYSFFLLTLF